MEILPRKISKLWQFNICYYHLVGMIKNVTKEELKWKNLIHSFPIALKVCLFFSARDPPVRTWQTKGAEMLLSIHKRSRSIRHSNRPVLAHPLLFYISFGIHLLHSALSVLYLAVTYLWIETSVQPVLQQQ